MKQYDVVVFECKTLKFVSAHVVLAERLEEARETGTVRHGKPNCFVTATPKRELIIY